MALVTNSEQLSVVELICARGLTAALVDQLLDVSHVALVCIAEAELVGAPMSSNAATKLITADASAWRRDSRAASDTEWRVRHPRCYRQLDMLGLERSGTGAPRRCKGRRLEEERTTEWEGVGETSDPRSDPCHMTICTPLQRFNSKDEWWWCSTSCE